MSIASSRVLPRAALVCLVVATLLATALAGRAAAGTGADVRTTSAARAARAPRAAVSSGASLAGATRRYDAPSLTTLRAGDREVLAYAPSRAATFPSGKPLTVVYLHGVHGLAEKGCPHVRAGATELGWLLCPEAIERDANGFWSWGGDVFEQGAVVRRALDAAHGRGASTEPGVAVGFSQGSYVALDLVKARLAKFRGLVLLGAAMHPDVKTLRDAGVTRIALGAGARDDAHASLREEARRIDAEGLETRFFDLGNVGHTYAAEDTAAMRDAIAWAGGV